MTSPSYCAPCIADLALVREAVTSVAGTSSCMAHAVLLTHSSDDPGRRRQRLDALTDEYDVVQVALAAVKLAHEATTGPAGEDAEDIPTVAARPESSYGAPDSGGPPRRGGAERPVRKSRPDATRVFIGLGRAAGLRPQDVVGAITGESSLSGRDIGSIEISDRFALVEVPSAAADEVVQALRKTKIKGRKATVRLDQGPTPR